MTDNRTTELESLSKLKTAGKLRYWRGTIEIPESELHAICNEIQAEYDTAVHALNKAAGNWTKADAELREKSDMAMARATDELRKSLDFMRIWISEDAHLGESAISRGLEKAEGLRKLDAIEQAIAATLGSELNPDGLPVGLTISEDGELLNWRGENYVKQSTLGSGTLTAEQVREVVDRHWHDLPTERDMPEATALPEYSYDWQAIADELNATLGGGECKVVASSTDGLTTDEPRQWFKLSCGHAFKLDGLDAPVACPVCGKAVKR